MIRIRDKFWKHTIISFIWDKKLKELKFQAYEIALEFLPFLAIHYHERDFSHMSVNKRKQKVV